MIVSLNLISNLMLYCIVRMALRTSISRLVHRHAVVVGHGSSLRMSLSTATCCQRSRFIPAIDIFHAKYNAFSRRCVSSAVNRNDLMAGVSPEHKEEIKRIVEIAERSLDTWEACHSPFYSPAVVGDAMRVLSRLADVRAIAWGGFLQAERCRISVGREESIGHFLAEENRCELETVSAVSVKGNFLFDPAAHPDFLGACLGTGIDRSVIGDVLIQGDVGAQILCSPSMVEHLESSLVQVRSVPVTTSRIDLSSLRVPEARVKDIQSIESSLRLDSVGSAGYRISRAKMADKIKGGDVKLNWKLCTKPSTEVAPGDLISCSGKGRLEIISCDATKKGKFAVNMKRFM